MQIGSKVKVTLKGDRYENKIGEITSQAGWGPMSWCVEFENQPEPLIFYQEELEEINDNTNRSRRSNPGNRTPTASN